MLLFESAVLQLDNQTPFQAGLSLFPDPRGVETLYIALKATFAFSEGKVRIAEKQSPMVAADELWGKPGESSIRYAGEAHLCKPATDVVLVGTAYAPRGKPAPRFGLSMAVGRMKKVIHVVGERQWVSGLSAATPSPPVPVAWVPLLWERAYGGGHDLGGGTVLCEPRNPVGCGFKGKRSHREMDGLPVPNLEDPRHPIDRLGDEPPPAGVGYVAASWQPRARFAGTYDETWDKKRAPFLPLDFDPRFLQEAPEDQIYPGRLQGGEPVELINAAPEGVQRFALPRVELEALAYQERQVRRPRLEIETLLLEPDLNRFSMLWRGAVPCGKRSLQMHLMEIGLKAVTGITS